jgi:hypothetical protein
MLDFVMVSDLFLDNIFLKTTVNKYIYYNINGIDIWIPIILNVIPKIADFDHCSLANEPYKDQYLDIIEYEYIHDSVLEDIANFHINNDAIQMGASFYSHYNNNNIVIPDKISFVLGYLSSGNEKLSGDAKTSYFHNQLIKNPNQLLFSKILPIILKENSTLSVKPHDANVDNTYNYPGSILLKGGFTNASCDLYSTNKNMYSNIVNNI